MNLETPLWGLPLPEIWFTAVFFVLAMFLFLDGFDFGVGAIYATRKNEEEKETLLAAIGPFWDGNEVWLVVFGGSLFAVFPGAYAGILSRNYLLVFGVLAALILRGLAPEFREQRSDPVWRNLWDKVFVTGSAGTPFLLGAFLANWVLPQPDFLAGTLTGLTLLLLTVVEGAAFLTIKTRDDLQREMLGYMRRAAPAYAAVFLVLIIYLSLTTDAGVVGVGGLAATGTILLLSLTVYAAAGRPHPYAAFVSSAAMTFTFVGVFAYLMYPHIDPAAGLLVRDAAVSTLPLNLMTIASAFLLPVVLLYFAVLYSVFSGPAGQGY